MVRTLPPLNALRAFESAARHESFSKAADELGVSHSAISRHVRGLEHRLSVRLFTDLPRGVALSPDGQRYFAAVSPALDRIAEATEALRDKAQGVLVVNSEALFAVKWLVPKVGTFRALYPDIELRLEGTATLIDVDRYEADIAIRFIRSGQPDVPADLVGNMPLAVYAAPELAKALREPADILRHAMYRDRISDHWPEWLKLSGVDTGLYSAETWRMRATLAIETALHGQGVLLASGELVAGHVAEGRLVRCFDTEIFEGAYFMIASGASARRKPVRLFREWLLSVSGHLRVPGGPGWDNQPVG